jgi:UDP-N-acetylglucosamine 2-epimerase (non-hydrolysing)
MNVLLIFGTRPEAIKMAPVLRELKRLSGLFQVKTCVTGQHREMLDQVLNFFEIIPDYDLSLMKPNQSLVDLTCSLLKEISTVIQDFKPDLVLVQGDTSTAFVAALAASYNKVKIGHIEAGLRSGSKSLPFPEEINRILVGHLSDYHFAPTKQAELNLAREGVHNEVHLVGNTVVDALLMTLQIIEKDKSFKYNEFFHFLDLEKKIILVTAHRRESFGSPLENICKALVLIANDFPETEIVFPVHLNPKVNETVNRFLSGIKNIYLIHPLEYPYLIWLLKHSYLVLTDSGGIQEEAPSLGKPVLVMRDVTERMEGIEAGTAKLVGTNESEIVRQVSMLLTSEDLYLDMSTSLNPYGDGQSSRKIANLIAKIA